MSLDATNLEGGQTHNDAVAPLPALIPALNIIPNLERLQPHEGNRSDVCGPLDGSRINLRCGAQNIC
jgi:hypothetical protein